MDLDTVTERTPWHVPPHITLERNGQERHLTAVLGARDEANS